MFTQHVDSTHHNFIVDHSQRWQIGYCKSVSHSGKYHLMLLDKVLLSARTLGHYAKREIVTIVPFILEQSTDTLQTMWNNGE